jgi:uncharacterized membrane protein
MESRAKLFGHSVHAMLIVFPVGLFATAVVFDVIHFISPGGPWLTVSYWMIVAGVLGGLIAALFGFIDFRGIPATTRARRIGRLHGTGNVVVVGLFAISAWIRHDRTLAADTTAFVLSFLGIALAAMTAWLGGELVERLGVGVDDGAHLDAPSSLGDRSAHAAPSRELRS